MTAYEDQQKYEEQQKRWVEEAGGKFLGTTSAPQRRLIWFTDPETRSTLAMYDNEVTSRKAIELHMEKSRRKFRTELMEQPITLLEASRRVGLDRKLLRQWLREDGYDMPGAGSKKYNRLRPSDVVRVVERRLVQTSAKPEKS